MSEPKKVYDLNLVRDISEKVYRLGLDDMSGGGPGAVDRMIADDGDGGVKLRNRAGAYDRLTRRYLGVLGIEPTVEVKKTEKAI